MDKLQTEGLFLNTHIQATRYLGDKLFNNLSHGGKVIVPMAKAPGGDYSGMFNDKFGRKWLIKKQAK